MIFPVHVLSYAITAFHLWISSPVSEVHICSGMLLCMKAGSHWSIGPHVPNGMEIVACSVAGLRRVGVVGACPLRARTAAMSAAVASTCANVGLTLAEGRYRTLMPADVGCRCQASVRCAAQVVASARVSTRRSLGEMASALQLKLA